jgi:putative flippase GtrA
MIGRLTDSAAAATPGYSRFFRFVVAGAANTTLSIAVYQVALFMFGYAVSYATAYVAGIAFSFYLYSKHVFHSPITPARLMAFASFYVLSLAAGSLANAAYVEWLGLPERLAIFATIAVMLPVNYLGSKWSLQGLNRPSI